MYYKSRQRKCHKKVSQITTFFQIFLTWRGFHPAVTELDIGTGIPAFPGRARAHFVRACRRNIARIQGPSTTETRNNISIMTGAITQTASRKYFALRYKALNVTVKHNCHSRNYLGSDTLLVKWGVTQQGVVVLV